MWRQRHHCRHIYQKMSKLTFLHDGKFDKSDTKYSALPFKTSKMGSYSQCFPVKVALKANYY